MADGSHIPEPATLDVDPILWLHRDPTGYIGFVKKSDPDAPPILDKNGKPLTFQHVAMIRADELRNTFPALVPYLLKDSFFTVHGFYRPQWYKNKTTGYPDVRRKASNALWLTACYADVDCGRPESDEPGADMEWLQALVIAETAMDQGIIPQASIMARSGRGVYLFWMLKDARDPSKLPHAWPEVIAGYKRINKAIQARLRDQARLPVDHIHDVARVLRVPGTIHSKTGRRAAYWLRGDAQGGFAYTLPELAEYMGLSSIDGDLPADTRKRAKPATYRKVKNPGSAPSRSHGTKALNALRAQDLLTLSQYRGGFLKRGKKYPDGSTACGRRFTLTLYANFLHGSGTDQDKALQAVASMAANMHPAWPDDPGDPTVEELVRLEYAATRRRRWTNKKLCPLLGITPDLARDLELSTIIPDEVKQERDQARPTQQQIVNERREWLRQYLIDHPNPGDGKQWTARKVRDALTPFSPHPWNNHETANQDLNAIGYQTHRSRGGRPRRKAPPDTGTDQNGIHIPEWLKGSG